jgi:hypothetical protein
VVPEVHPSGIVAQLGGGVYPAEHAAASDRRNGIIPEVAKQP